MNETYSGPAGRGRLDARVEGVLERLGRQADLERGGRIDVPRAERMLAITRQTGQFYSVLLEAAGARRILEVGTSAGYSTLWFAACVAGRGSVVTIERDAAKADRAEKNLAEAGVSGSVSVVRGEALDALRDMDRRGRSFDFAFIDADKENAPAYFDLAFGMLEPGGLVGTDNMLYPEKYRPMMEAYAARIRAMPGARTATLPVGNGQELTVKLR